MTNRLSPHDIIYGLIGAGDPQLSPDGTQVAWVRSQAIEGKLRSESQIWIADSDGSNKRQLTQPSTANSSPRWSPDGSQLAFVSTRNGKAGIYTIDPTGGEAVSRHDHPTTLGEIAWSPDGSRIAFVALFDPANPDNEPLSPESVVPVRVVNRIDYKQENRGYLNDARNAVWILGLESGDVKRLTDDRIDHLAPVWSGDGTRIATKISRSNGMTSQLAVLDALTGERIVIIGPEEGFVSTWAFTPDGSSLLFSGDTTQSWQADWYLYKFAAQETQRLSEDSQISVDGGFPTVSLPAQPVWLDADNVLYHGFRFGQSGLYRLTVSSGESDPYVTWPSDRADSVLWPGMHAGFSVDSSGEYAVQVRTTPNSPGEIIRVNLKSNKTETIDEPNSGVFSESSFGPWEKVSITRDGVDLDGWFLMPAGFDEGCQYPLVLDIHGGPNAHHGPGFNIVQQALAGAGYIVLSTNPRGSTSYGRAFTQAVVGDWAGEDYLDQMAFVDEACKRSYVDPTRLGVYGYSYGGFMTSWIVGHTDRFKAAVIGAPLVDQTSFYGTADIGHTFTVLQVGGTPWENPEEYRKRSPITYLHQATTPSLIVHGEQDDRVPIGQGEQAFMTLKQAGCVTEFVRYPGQAHAMLRTGPAAYKLDYLERVIGWFAKYLG